MSYGSVSEDRGPRVTLHSHAELRVLAAAARGHAPEEGFEPGVAELRTALGVGEAECLECWLLVDRSGSVLFDRDELQQVTLAWHFGSFDSELDRVGILGFSGYGDYVNLFEFKTPLNRADRALMVLSESGGGGTPTAEAVAHATTVLRSSTADVKLVIVVTDAPANDTAECAEAVRAAESEGVRVVGVLKPESRHERPGANHDAFMGEQFGSDWFRVDSYIQTPSALLDHLASRPEPVPRRTPRRHPALEPELPVVQERLIATAAEALLTLGDEAAYEFSERELDASDPQLRTLAHYLRLRWEELHVHGDDLFSAAIRAAGVR